MFSIGTRVQKIGSCFYQNYDTGIPIGSKGTILEVRNRYQGTPNSYILYIIRFDEYEFIDISHQYIESSLSKFL